MPSLGERIQILDDFQVVRFFDRFSRQLIAGANVSLDHIKSGIPDSARALEGFEQIENLSHELAEQCLDPSTSATLARSILTALSANTQFAPLIESVLDGYRDDELVADAILAVGLVASMLLIIATTEFTAEGKNWKFTKRGASPELVKAITEPCAKLISILSPEGSATEHRVSRTKKTAVRPTAEASYGDEERAGG
jgi:hypothetical protein